MVGLVTIHTPAAAAGLALVLCPTLRMCLMVVRGYAQLLLANVFFTLAVAEARGLLPRGRVALAVEEMEVPQTALPEVPAQLIQAVAVAVALIQTLLEVLEVPALSSFVGLNHNKHRLPLPEAFR